MAFPELSYLGLPSFRFPSGFARNTHLGAFPWSGKLPYGSDTDLAQYPLLWTSQNLSRVYGDTGFSFKLFKVPTPAYGTRNTVLTAPRAVILCGPGGFLTAFTQTAAALDGDADRAGFLIQGLGDLLGPFFGAVPPSGTEAFGSQTLSKVSPEEWVGGEVLLAYVSTQANLYGRYQDSSGGAPLAAAEVPRAQSYLDRFVRLRVMALYGPNLAIPSNQQIDSVLSAYVPSVGPDWTYHRLSNGSPNGEIVATVVPAVRTFFGL